MANIARLYVEQSQQYIKDGKPNDFIKTDMSMYKNDIKLKSKMISFNGIYDANPKIKFLQKAKPIDDEYTMENINDTNISVQCFDVGSRKIIKVWVVASHNGFSFYNDINKLQRNYKAIV